MIDTTKLRELLAKATPGRWFWPQAILGAALSALSDPKKCAHRARNRTDILICISPTAELQVLTPPC